MSFLAYNESYFCWFFCILITQNGNAIVKSNGGKKVGTALGVLGTATALTLPADKFIKGGAEAIGGKNYIQAFKNYIKGNNTSKMFETLTKKLPKSGRIGAVTVLTVMVVPAVICRGIGKLVDKVRDNRHAKKADIQAIADKLNGK